MTQDNYEAWDGKTYDWPPPSGWYLAHDQKWWPEGYGPDSDGKQGQSSDASSTADTNKTATSAPTGQAAATAAADSAAQKSTAAAEKKQVEIINDGQPEQNTQQAAPVQKTQQAAPAATAAASEPAVTQAPKNRNVNNDVRSKDPVADLQRNASQADSSSDRSGFGAGLDDSKSGGGGLVKILGAVAGLLGLVVLGLLLLRVIGGGGDTGSIGDPYAIGQGAGLQAADSDVQVWGVTITSGVARLSETEVAELDPPAAGNVYVKANATYSKQDATTTVAAPPIKAVTSGGTSYDPNPGCMATAGALPAGDGSGFVCWQVAEADVDNLVASVRLEGAAGDVHFALNN